MALTDAQRLRLMEGFAKYDFERTSVLYVAIGRYVASHAEILEIYSTLPEEKHHSTLLFAAVHYMVLDGEGEGLTRIYETPEDRHSLESGGAAFVEFVNDNWDELLKIMTERSLQTNEVNRCVALLPSLMTVYREHRQPLALIELGASGGLNLLFDRYRYDYAGGPVIGPPGATVRLSTQLRGRVPRMDAATPPVEFRVGIDQAPIDINDDQEVLWLRACIWVGDVARDQRLTAAVALARKEWPDVREGDAVTMLPQTVQEVPKDLELCIFTSWMMSWMERTQREALVETVKAIGQSRRVWWITYEGAGKVPGIQDPEGIDSASSVLGMQQFGPDGTQEGRPLATVQHHGAWLDWVDSETAAW